MTTGRCEERGDLDCSGPERQKREIASSGSILSSRAQRGDLAFVFVVAILFCHREEHGDLAFPEPANKKMRDCFVPRNDKTEGRGELGHSGAGKPKREIALQARNDKTEASQRGNLAF